MNRKHIVKIVIGMLIIAMLLPTAGIASIDDNQFKTSISVTSNVKPLNGQIVGKFDGNIQISQSENDDTQPTITKDPAGHIIVAYSTQPSFLEQEIELVYSETGETWIPTASFFSDEGGWVQYPSIVSIPETNDIGLAFMDPYGSYPLTMWRLGDVTDTGTYQGVAYIWGETEDYEETAVTYVHELMLTMCNLHNYYIQEIERCPYIIYLLPTLELPTEIGANYFDGQSVMKTAPATNLDLATGLDYFYLVMEHANETTGYSEIALKKTVTDLELLYTPGGGPEGMDKYADIEVMPWQFYVAKGDFDAKDPSISASGSNVVVIYMSNEDTGSDWDIKCAYSSDHGETWGLSSVTAEHPADEVYPASYMSGNSVLCTFIKDGDLYLVTSEDGGVTWGEPQRVNEVDGTVVSEPRATGVSNGGIVWTDTRNGNKDIYWAAGAATAEIVVQSVSGGFGVSAEIENVGTAGATDIQWSIDISGGLILSGGHTEGVIETLGPGDSITVNSDLILGLGAITINVAAGGSTKTASGTLLLIFVIGL